MNDMLQELNWDSQVFGFKTGEITAVKLKPSQLKEVLTIAKACGYKLLYWRIMPEDSISMLSAAEKNGLQVDEKVTYHLNLDNFQTYPSKAIPYRSKKLNNDLINLALESGIYSRYKMDPFFPIAIYEKLYKIWIIRSIRKEIADEIIISKQDDKIVSMATLFNKNGAGNIGLVSVDKHYLGKGIGYDTIMGVLAWFHECKFSDVFVCTQNINHPAKNLYEKSGFKMYKREFIYHFWI